MAAFWATALAAAALLLTGAKGPAAGVLRGTPFDPLPASSASAEPNPWGAAVRQVTEDRGEPTGRQAKVEVPGQLRHYSDTRRFLAIQLAEWKEHRFSTPHDYAGLAGLIRAGELVEVPAVAESYVLFGVGGLADAEAFTHYDKATGKSVPLFDEAGLAAERARLNEAEAAARASAESLRGELKSLGKAERGRAAELRARVEREEKSLKSARDRAALLDRYYGSDERSRDLADERGALALLAADFEGRHYDLSDPRAVKSFKVRLLGHLRPEALAVMRELADSYHARFGRPLPVTSLVRPDEYQHRLSRTNANATRIETPPHSTGLAFDILYRHMTAEEQAHVMSDIARLRDEGRVESLRENRDHFHVFAFVDGKRPSEEIIRASLNHSSAKTREDEEEAPAAPVVKKAETKKAEKKSEKKRSAGREVSKGARKEQPKRAAKSAGRRRR